MDRPIWTPSEDRLRDARITAFMARAAERRGAPVPDYQTLWQWSIDEREDFWSLIWDFFGIIAEAKGERILVDDGMPGAGYFPDARFNFAENLLPRRDDTPALIFRGEDRIRRTVSWRELHDTTSRLARAFRAQGIGPGDRIAAYMPNIPETVMVMLAASSIGATFSSASPDFGVQGVVDRFGQIEPRILVSADGYFYNGKAHSSLDRLPDILAGMPAVERTVIVPYTTDAPDLSAIPRGVLLDDLIAPHAAGDIVFEQLPFGHPLYIMFSSGTTGVPKCIVHGQGGALLQHLKEHQLHCDTRPGDRVFWFTTCGWMMWNWLVTGLAGEETLLLYDGSPFWPDGNAVFDFADESGMTFFGTSAKFLDACNKAGIEPVRTHDLSTVRGMGSTGSPLVPEGFDYVYEKVKRDLHLASVSGGTDLLACFVNSSPVSPVWRGEIQVAALGMATDVFDDDGQRRPAGEQGELVCTKSFPSMPLGFWDDDDGARYHAAYFERFPGIWCHGDWIARTEHGGYIIYGRSDATLNSGGVRIGTAEIYRQVEQLDEIVESIVIGQEWDNDTRIVLFVRLADGVEVDDDLEAKIRRQVRDNTTPRHVPARIVPVTDIPRTRSGKIVELAVREVVHGRPVKNRDALANPEALEQFANRTELAS